MFTLKIILLSIGLIAIAVLGLATRILLKKKGKFPKTSVGHNPEMRKLGINCAGCEEEKQCANVMIEEVAQPMTKKTT